MWLDDCEQEFKIDLSKPITLIIDKTFQGYDCFRQPIEGRVVKTITYKTDEFGNRCKFVCTE